MASSAAAALAKAERSASNVFLGGTPASERFHTSAATTFTDTRPVLSQIAGETATLRRGMKGQGQKEHFTLGAEVRDFSTSGFQPDHLAARSVEDKLAEAADKRLLGFTKKNMQAKHFELGLVPPHYETLAMATFQYDAAKSRAEGDKNAAERRERKDGAQRTNFTLGATPTDYTSEAAHHFSTPQVELDRSKTTEKTVPLAQTANVTIGLVPVDYTTAAQHVNNVSMKLRAAAAKNPGAADKKMDRASLNRTNWALGLDDMMEEGHYTSQTMKDMWGTKLPPTAGQATAVRTRSGIKDARVVPPAVADDSPGWLSNLERMKRKPRSGGSSATDSKGSALSRAGAQVATS